MKFHKFCFNISIVRRESITKQNQGFKNTVNFFTNDHPETVFRIKKGKKRGFKSQQSQTS